MNTKKIFALVILTTVLVALTSAAYVPSNEPTTKRHAHNLAGSWQINITPNPESGVPPFVNFSAMTKDGRLINSNDTGHTAIGDWIKVKAHQYAVSFTGFDQMEGQTIQSVVNSTVELSAEGDTFSGPFTTDLYDAEGNLLFSITGTIEATRMSVLPME